MIVSLLSSSWLLSFILVAIPSLAVILGLLYLVRIRFSHEDLRKSHDVVGFTFSIVGVLYSVILGFTVVSLQESYNQTVQALKTEAFTLADLYRDAALFEPENKNEIRSALRAYVHHTVEKDWPPQDAPEKQMESQKMIEKIWHSYYPINLTSERTKIWYAESISKLDDFLDARLYRKFNSYDHLSSMMWCLLIVGAIITISFMFFFGFESMKSQMFMTALLVGYLTFMLNLVYSLDHVYRGSEGIKPTALVQILKLFDRWDQASSLSN